MSTSLLAGQEESSWSRSACVAATRAAWLSTTPRGLAPVPAVKQTVAVSSGRGGWGHEGSEGRGEWRYEMYDTYDILRCGLIYVTCGPRIL